jgi:hypothetical protein
MGTSAKRLGSSWTTTAVAGPAQNVRCSTTHPNSKAEGYLCGAIVRSRPSAAGQVASGGRQVRSNCGSTSIKPFAYQDAVKGRYGELALPANTVEKLPALDSDKNEPPRESR